MPFVDLPADAKIDPIPQGGLADLPANARLDGQPDTSTPHWFQMLQGMTDALGRNFSFGLTDKAAALGRTVGAELKGSPGSFSDLYHQKLADVRGEGQQFKTEHPVAYQAGAIPGVAGSVGLFNIPSAPTLGGQVLQGAKAGATAGGLSAYGEGNDTSLGQTAKEVGTGIGVGTVAGGAIPVGVSLLTRPVSAAARAVGLSSPEKEAAAKVANAIRADVEGGGPSARDIGATLDQFGNKPLSIADVGGKNVQALGGTAFRSGGPASQEIENALTSRDSAAGTRLLGDVSETAANGPGNFTLAEQLTEHQKTQAAPLYKQAFAANKSVSSPLIDRILATPEGKSALGEAVKNMQNEMLNVGVADPELSEAAREAAALGKMDSVPGGVASGLKLRTLDYVKQALGDTERAAKSGSNPDLGQARRIGNLRRLLTNELDRLDVTAAAGPNSLKPEGGLYAQARAAYSGPAAIKDALEEGASALNKPADEITATLAKLSPSEQNAYRLGAANALKARLGSVSPGGDESLKLIGNLNMRNNLRALFPNADDLINRAFAERSMAATNLATRGGSQTAERVASDKSAEGALGGVAKIGGGVAAAISGEPFLGASLGARGIGQIWNAMAGPDKAAMAHIGRMLYSTNPAEREAAMRAIQAQLNVVRPSPGLLAAPVAQGTSGLLSGR